MFLICFFAVQHVDTFWRYEHHEQIFLTVPDAHVDSDSFLQRNFLKNVTDEPENRY